ncbi:MAG: hypothetical protein ACR2JO_05440 [Mycobacteriales bacterium]
MTKMKAVMLFGRRPVAAIVGVVLLATACGGGDGNEATKPKGAPAASSAAAGRNSVSVAGGEKFCDVIKAQFGAFTEYTDAPLLDVAARKRYGLTSKQLNDKLVKIAPAELGADVVAQTRVANGVADAFASGRSPGAAALAQLRSPEYQAAARRVSAYAKDHCGIGVTATTK